MVYLPYGIEKSNKYDILVSQKLKVWKYMTAGDQDSTRWEEIEGMGEGF